MNRVEIAHWRRIVQVGFVVLLLAAGVIGCTSSPSSGNSGGTGSGGSSSGGSSNSGGSGGSGNSTAGTPVCSQISQLGALLGILQTGPSGNVDQEMQAIGTELSGLAGQTSQQSSDLSSFQSDLNSTITGYNNGGGSMSPILAGLSSMNNDLGALEADCPGS
jgi:hypothetical protein